MQRAIETLKKLFKNFANRPLQIIVSTRNYDIRSEVLRTFLLVITMYLAIETTLCVSKVAH